jgi:LmbE family N-acetylglucosaminyl deacetylase
MRTVLVVAAHADDEAFGCSGAMARHVAEGDAVHVVFMTDGVGARCLPDISSSRERHSAAEQACAILGGMSVRNYDFPDNQMDSVPLLSVTQALESVVSNIRPDIIYTHHIGDLNVDHQVTHKAVMTACRPQPEHSVKEIYAFEVLSSTEWQSPGVLPFIPNVFIDITAFMEIKHKVLSVYQGEMRLPPHSRSFENLLHLSKLRGNTVGFEYAEAFMLVRYIR